MNQSFVLSVPNGLGHMVPEASCLFEEDIVKARAKFQAEFMLGNSTMPEAGKDYEILPPLPTISDAVYLGAIRDLLNMDVETLRSEVPGRVGALYVGLAKIFDIADARSEVSPAMREIAGIAAAAFGETQHGHAWQRKTAQETMLEQSLAREVEARKAAGNAS